MDTKHQFYYFCICVAVGFFSGIAYEVFSLIRAVFGGPRGKCRVLGIGLDIAFFVVLLLITTTTAFVFRFPAFRVYMWAGYAVGLILYSKSLHRMVAFFQNICYNRIAKRIEKTKTRRKTLKKEGREYDAG